MHLVVEPTGFSSATLICGARTFRCALGRGGARSDKREGDGATPIGLFALRRLLYRADRVARPLSGLPTDAIDPASGWCDDPARPDYNRLITLPYDGRHERLWRDDALYDMIAVIGYNETAIIPGAGSAIFLHVAAPDYGATEGCVAVAADHLTEILAYCDTTSTIRILSAKTA